jgi:Ca-activated chloride channel family protein
MSLERPWLLVTLFLVPLAVAAYVLLRRRGGRYAVLYTNIDVLALVTTRGGLWRTHVPAALLGLAFVALAVAVARPQLTQVALIERATVILVLDTSRSMESQDVKPSRLVAARAAASAFLERVPEKLRVGLIAFSGDVSVLAAPTTDHELVDRSIGAIGTHTTGYGGTAIGDALARAVELARDAMRERELASAGAVPESGPDGAVSILFLSDGRQNRGILPPAEGARLAEEAGLPVYTVALGTRQAGAAGSGPGPGQGFSSGARYRAPDPATLRMIAQRTGGEFFETRSRAALSAAYESLGSRLGRASRTTEVTFAFVAFAAVALAAAALCSPLLWPRLP